MKKRILSLTIVCIMVFGLTACGGNLFDLFSSGKAPDYSQEVCWFSVPEITKDVDTFYIYPTEYSGSSYKFGAPDYASLDNPDMLRKTPIKYLSQASVFEFSTNVFIPYYRQAGLKLEEQVAKKTGDIDDAISGKPYEDITAALDYYFENYNNGRPFILAGHSQGAAIVKMVLKNYFKDHPDYYERMVVSYIIGYSVTTEDLEECPHLKFAAGETDTGVMVSWNTEGEKNVEENAWNIVVLPHAISINPLNWKLDETYASSEENKGSFIMNWRDLKFYFADIGADAQIDTERGVIITNAKAVPAGKTNLFGPQSYHNDEYSLFYANIMDNVEKRITAYKSAAN